MTKFKDGLIAVGGNIQVHQVGFMVTFDNNAQIPCMVTDEALRNVFNWSGSETKEECFERNKELA